MAITSFIINHIIQNADAWESVQGIPAGTQAWSMQARTSQIFEYRHKGQSNWWTVKASLTRSGNVPIKDLEVRCSVVGTIIEIECSPIIY